jgi:hypothetical protein
MKKKSGIFVDNLPGRLVKNSFLSVYRSFQKNKGENSGNSKDFPHPFLLDSTWPIPYKKLRILIQDLQEP